MKQNFCQNERDLHWIHLLIYAKNSAKWLFLGEDSWRWLVFTLQIGEMIQFDELIFQLGWFNHQLDFFLPIEMVVCGVWSDYEITFTP